MTTTQREPTREQEPGYAEHHAREREVRRQAKDCGYVLRRSRSRDPEAPDHGLYNLFDPSTGGAVMAHNDAVLSPFNWSLEQVSDYLNDPRT